MTYDMIIEEGDVTDNHCVSGTPQGNQHRVFLDGKLKTVQQGLTLVNRRKSVSFFHASWTHLSLMYLSRLSILLYYLWVLGIHI